MTAAVFDAPRYADRSALYRLLRTPLWMLFGEAALMHALIFGLSAQTAERMVVVLMTTFVLTGGMVMLGPHRQLAKVRIPLSALFFLAWTGLSFFYARNQTNWLGLVRTEFWSLVPITLAIGMLPLDRAVRALLRTVYVIIALQIFALLTDPFSRGSAGGVGFDAGFGWQGSFVHKNALATVSLLSIVLIFALEDRPLVRRLAVAPLVVFVIMARSSTGLSAAVGVLALTVWLNAYLRRPQRERTAFTIAWAIVGLIIASVIVAFAGVLVSLYGKDLTFSGRTYIWDAAMNQMQGWRWLFGWSFDAHVLNTEYPHSEIRDSVQFQVPHLHNGAVELLWLLGIPGLALGVALLGAVAKTGTGLLRDHPHLGRGLVLAAASIAIFNFSEVKVLDVWAAIMIMLIVLATRARELGWDGPRSGPLPPATVAIEPQRPAPRSP